MTEQAVVARTTRLGWVKPLIGLAAVLVAGLLGLVIGPADISPVGAMKALLDGLPLVELPHGLSDTEIQILYEIRFPRVVLGALVGAVLALSGGSYQGVFKNPLADPYLLGVAAGAGLGATIAFSVAADRWAVVPLAFLGGVAAVAVAYALGRSVGGRTTTSLILAGVAVASFALAVQTYMLQRRVEALREVYSWILGRLTTVGWSEVLLLVPYAILAALVLLGARRLLDVLSVGDEEAASLGVRVDRVRIVVVLAATLATAAAVSVSGLIGFVGLIVPHTIRLAFGWSYRIILPLSLIYGSVFLILADLVARTVLAPAELPIGVVTAFIGAPFFVLVLRTSRDVT